MKPTIGRIVLYGQLNGLPAVRERHPAIVQAVNDDGSVRLFVFGPASYSIQNNVTEGEGPGQWIWPTRV